MIVTLRVCEGVVMKQHEFSRERVCMCACVCHPARLTHTHTPPPLVLLGTRTLDNAMEGAALIKYLEVEILEHRKAAYEAQGSAAWQLPAFS